ncbi:MAG: PspC domain-containing protein [Flavobacteriaceae bacterium]|nr:PspC domain-containing protein [Bacteroidia bacterium]NNL61722.1 PspC domain-containing protein [Flavobacteriaceae bacterium]RZV65461.1 MAG: PspC domain-containing protein [Flavobacteriaceae bacterium]RZW45851.1 MAG: PspC domain-containing protein [Flavobacteriaceae bacterium]
MNKTVNINLAGIFFHIDEDAYAKLQRYLEAIRRSFTDSQGQSEIIADIEARIAELFNERVDNDKQVVGMKVVDEVITIMGQPEDYLVDDEIFEDEPKSWEKSRRSTKKLFRDTDNSYIGGVSAGLGHYLGIDAVWVRLLWILLAIGSGGTFIFIYILFWVLVPEALTTSEKLTMTGEPVNISNIEKKIKDGFETVSETVSDTVKNIDLPKQGERIKSTSKSFFDALGDVIMFFFKVFAKFIGVIMIIVGAATLIALVIALLTTGIADAIHVPGFDFAEAAMSSRAPIWLVSLLTLFAVGIPFFVLFYLGLKILVNNLKSIGTVAKLSLLGLWLISIISLAVLGIRQAAEHAIDDISVTTQNELMITPSDTLTIKMASNSTYSKRFGRYSARPFTLIYDENDQKKIYSTDIRLIVRSTKDSMASISVEKIADGRTYEDAKDRARAIEYGYELKDNTLLLDSYLTTDFDNKYRDQSVELTLYLPEGTTVYADDNTYSYHRNDSYYNDILKNGTEEHYQKVIEDDMICLDCDEDNKEKDDIMEDSSGLRINEDGVQLKGEKGSLKIDDEGIKAKSEDVKVNIDENGIEITSDDS